MWQEIISQLVASGLSERQIADEVKVSQPTINRLKLGRRKKIAHDTGEALIALHRRVCRKSHA